ncbi:MAG: hypothetical protein FJX74_09180 [Armatimonadetes bacterium]|nr:hypothetical protein [Armatimonadota bacterium]
MHWLALGEWSPYVVGIGIGVLSWITFILSDKPIGCSTAFTRASGMLERLLRGRGVLNKEYYRQFVPEIEWEWMLVVGVVVGAFISARLSGESTGRWVPDTWAASFGASPVLRWVVALVGGVLMGVGARWAGGCTSGHGISGTLQLAASSWLAAMGFFAGGIVMAMFIFRVLG